MNNKFINGEKLQYAFTQLWAKMKNTFAQKNGENTFTKKNTFDEAVMIKRESMYIHSPINNKPATLTGMQKLAGYRGYTSHSNGNNGYVKSVKVRVKDDSTVGHTLRYIDLWAVEKKDNLAQDVIVGKMYDSSVTWLAVKEEEGFGKYVEIFVNRKFENETYFLVEHSNSVTYTKPTDEDDDDIVYARKGTVPEVGTSGLTSESKRYLLQYGLVGESMNIARELEKISNGTGKLVSSVNTVKPNDKGDVTVAPKDIPGLLSVNGKIHPDLVPDVAITNVTAVDSEDAAMQLTSKIGDVVIRNDLNGESYICKNPLASTFAERFARVGSASDAVKTINNQASSAGNVDLGLKATATQLELTANSHTIATLPIITDQEVSNIINGLN